MGGERASPERAGVRACAQARAPARTHARLPRRRHARAYARSHATRDREGSCRDSDSTLQNARLRSAKVLQKECVTLTTHAFFEPKPKLASHNELALLAQF